MRNLHELDRYRAYSIERAIGYGVEISATAGGFYVPSASERVKGSTRPVRLKVIASACQYPWDHVSVSAPGRVPTWAEMEQVKRLFFEDHETAMQLHVPPADHVNNHPYCLHLWRPHLVEIPRPPAVMVGIKDATPAEVRRMALDLGATEEELANLGHGLPAEACA